MVPPLNFLFSTAILFEMSPEEKNLLERVAVLSEENNHILRGIRRANRWGSALKIIYWVAIIVISYGAYIYVQPYVDQLVRTYAEVAGTVNKVSDQIPNVEKVLNGLPR